MWTLILTVFYLSHNEGSVAMTTSPGFQSREACLTAGNAFVAMKTTGVSREALCINTSQWTIK